MEEVKNECPTEILVELKEDSFVPSHVNHNDFQNLLDDHKSDVHLKDEEYLVFERKPEAYKSILDMSPFRIKEKFCHTDTSNIDFEAKQDIKTDLNIDDCPTGILVDLPNNSDLPFKSCAFSYKTPYTRIENKVSHLQNSVIGTTDSEKEVYLSTGIKNCRLSGDTDNDCYSKSNEGESKSFASRSRFKTPSPQSMSLISSEVSKVINTLNSSIAFDEDDLLNEEMLPIPLNFDDFDDISDREKQLPKVTDVSGNKIGDHEISTSVQTQDNSNKSDENIECDTIFHPDVNENLKVSSTNKDYLSPLSAEADISDREKQLPEVADVRGNKIGNHEISTHVQTQDSSNKSDENIECNTIFHLDVNENLKVSSTSEDYPSPLSTEADISDREKQLPKVTDVCGNKIGNHEISTSVQTQNSYNKSDENIERDTIFHPDVNENLKVSSTSEDYLSPLSAEAGCSPAYSYDTEKTTSDEHSKEHISCEIKSDSLDISRISASADSTDDVFTMSHITDEDKENAQGHEVVLPKKSLKSCNTLQKKSLISEKKGSRETLKNLSNIKPKYANKDSALRLSQNSHNKQKEAPQMKMSHNSKTKMLQPPPNKKLQLKKTVSAMESRTASKRMSLSNSFHFQSSKELIPSLQRPSLVEQNKSFRPNLSHKSYIKQENLEKMKGAFATPSRRYSISTPLKGAALKPQFTPLLQGSQNRALPRFTPQSVGSSRLSFSKSLQPSSTNSHFSMKQQCSTSVSSKLNQPSVARLNLTKADKSFGQDAFPSNSKILGKSSLSTSNTKKFSSKLSLPSPFSAVQDKHLARVLFPSDP